MIDANFLKVLLPYPIPKDEGNHGGEEDDKSAKPNQVGHVGAAGAPVTIEDEPGEQVHEEDVETEVAVEVAAYPLPFEPEEAGDHGMLQQVAMLLKVVVIEIKKELKIR